VRGPADVTGHDGRDRGDDLRVGVRTCGEREDGATVVMTGSYHVRGVVSQRLLAALPRVLVVPDEGEMCPLMELTLAEVGRHKPGQQAVLDRLLDLLLLTTLREWFDRPEATPPAWYRALGDPIVGTALRFLHQEPERPWTVAGLAAEVGSSRAALARRFTDLIGEPPMTYLTGWRLSLAADLLQRTSLSVDAIARQVGYRSGYGLSVAFKRVHGIRPSYHRARRKLTAA
jgi:AraC-like DNA-binding protein